jgi:hypothetical protein
VASITFNDGTSATLDNGTTAIAAGVGSRFAAWTPFTRRVGDTAVALATGARNMFIFRTDYGASFELRDVPVTNLAVALRLVRHLQGGGVCTVTTGDTASRTYTNCGLDPEGSVEIAQQDAQLLLYSVRLSLVNLSGADMLCTYD